MSDQRTHIDGETPYVSGNYGLDRQIQKQERIDALIAENAELRAERDRIQFQYDAALAELEELRGAPRCPVCEMARQVDTALSRYSDEQFHRGFGCHIGRTAARETEGM